MNAKHDLVRSLDRGARAIIDAVTYSSAVRAGAGARPIGGAVCAGVVRYLGLTGVRGEGGEEREALAREIAADARSLLALQNPDGTIDGSNIRTPPDTGFVMETVGAALLALREVYGTQIPSPALADVVAGANEFMRRAATALVTGGVHTPNHRWVVSSALAFAYRLYGRSEYLARIDEWLTEGIDIDEDGQYSEHSSGIYSAVSSSALLNVALLLGRDELLEPVRRNLETTLLLAQPDGRIDTTASRRQDQYDTTLRWFNYYVPLRVLAAIDGNPRFAAAARSLERWNGDHGTPLSGHAIAFFAFPAMRAALPGGDTATVPTDFAAIFAESGLYRERRGEVAVTIFGGHDRWSDGEVTPEVSGRAGNPTFLTFCVGPASIRWVRIVPRFFNIGYLRPRMVSPGAGLCRLEAAREVGYFQPLPPEKRRPDGRYALTTGDGRFWSATDLPERARSNVQSVGLSIAVRSAGSRCEVAFEGRSTTAVALCVEIAVDPESAVEVEGWNAEPRRATVENGTSQIDITLEAQRGDPWIPAERDYGDHDRMRRAMEREKHRPPLQIIHGSFLVPGTAILTLSGRPGSRERGTGA